MQLNKQLTNAAGRELKMTVGEAIILTLEGTKSQSFDEMRLKAKILEKLAAAGEQIVFSTEEIALVKQKSIEVNQPDAFLLPMLREICPNDFQ